MRDEGYLRSISIRSRHLPHREENLRHAEEGQDGEQGDARQDVAHYPGGDPEAGDDVVGNEEAMEAPGASGKGSQENGIQGEYARRDRQREQPPLREGERLSGGTADDVLDP